MVPHCIQVRADALTKCTQYTAGRRPLSTRSTSIEWREPNAIIGLRLAGGVAWMRGRAAWSRERFQCAVDRANDIWQVRFFGRVDIDPRADVERWQLSELSKTR